MEPREYPCCMCPAEKIAFVEGRCDNCNFAVTFEDKRGYRYFVRKGIADTGFKTFYTVPGKAKQRSCQTIKEWRDTFVEAQMDLNKVAKERCWTVVEKEPLAG